MSEKLNKIWSDSILLSVYLQEKSAPELAKLEKAKRRSARTKMRPDYSSTLASVSSSFQAIVIDLQMQNRENEILDRRAAQLRNELIAGTATAYARSPSDEGLRLIVQLHPDHWTSGELEPSNNSLRIGESRFEEIRLPRELILPSLVPADQIRHAVRECKSEYEARTGKSWMHEKRKARYSAYRLYIQRIYRINANTAQGYSDSHLEKLEN